MNWGLGHPSARLISRFVDEECGPRTRKYVREHLGECHRCRRKVAFMRELGRVAREIPSPVPPHGTLDRILERWEAGDRMILPVETLVPVDPYSNLKRAGMVTTGLLAAAAAFALLWPTGDVGADSSALRLDAGRPTVGAEIPVEYRPTTALAGEDSLRLRARYRTATDRADERSVPQVDAATLHREGDGLFRGRVRLPSSAVYGRFAVEDFSGETVDLDHGSEILVEDGTGRPLFEALAQRLLELEGRSWEEARETVRRMTVEYPQRAEGWHWLFYLDAQSIDPEGAGATVADPILTAHRGRFQEMDRRLASRAELPPEEIAAMLWFAAALGESEARARWQRRLIEEHPTDRRAVKLRIFSLMAALPGEPERYLGALDELWAEVGPVSPTLAEQGFNAAVRLEEFDAATRWAGRWAHAAPWQLDRIATSLVAQRATRAHGVALLRQLVKLHETPLDRYRGLGRTVEEERWAASNEVARLWLALAGALREEGEVAEARAALSRAVGTATEAGWHPEVLEELAEAELALGDTAAAVDLWARRLADPRIDSETASELWNRLRNARGSAGIEGRIARHWEALQGLVLDRSQPGTHVPPAEALDREGRAVSLDDALLGRVCVVLFWSAASPASVAALGTLNDLYAWFVDRGVSVLAITKDPVEAGQPGSPPELALTLPILFDGSEAARAFNVWGTPTVFVLDRFGQVRFTNSDDFEAVRLQAAVLGAQETLAASN